MFFFFCFHKVPEGRVWQELQSDHWGGFRDGTFRGAWRSLQSTAVSTKHQTAAHTVTRWLFLSSKHRLAKKFIRENPTGSGRSSCIRVQLEFPYAALTLVHESWNNRFAFIKLVSEIDAYRNVNISGHRDMRCRSFAAWSKLWEPGSLTELCDAWLT